MRKIVLVLLAGIALAGCKTAEQALIEAGKKPITAAEVTALRSDNTISVQTASGYTGAGFWKADGSISYKADSSSSFDSKGTYEIKADGQTCVKWENPRMTGRCVKTYAKEGGKYVEIELDGSEGITITKVEKGNPRGL